MAKGGSFDMNGQPSAQTLGPGRTAVRPPSRKGKTYDLMSSMLRKEEGRWPLFFYPRLRSGTGCFPMSLASAVGEISRGQRSRAHKSPMNLKVFSTGLYGFIPLVFSRITRLGNSFYCWLRHMIFHRRMEVKRDAEGSVFFAMKH